MKNKHTKIKLNSGNEMPIVGFGTYQLSDKATECVEYALKKGFRLVDTSSNYGSQPHVGKAVQNSEIPRDEIFIETKVESEDKNSYKAAKDYVNEMDLEYADLIVIHHPPEGSAGEHLWEGLIMAKEDGITKDIGVSNYKVSQIENLINDSGVVPAVNQIEWTPFGHMNEMRKYCEINNIIIQAYSPLTRGDRLDDKTILDIAKKHKKSPAQVLIRWNIQQEIVVPIVKSEQKEHTNENINVFNFELTDEDMDRLNELNEHYSSFGNLRYIPKSNFFSKFLSA